MISTFAGYSNIANDLTRSLSQVRQQPPVQRETEYYLENIGQVDTIEQLVEDTRLFTYAMRAHGLSDMAYAKAFMVKVLEEGRDSEDSFANTLADSRYREFAETFDFFRYGSSATTFGRAREGVVDKYLRQTLEEDAGASNEGIRLALYFERKAPNLESIYSILADRALGVVVRTALGLPETTALLDIDKQVELIGEKLTLSDFQDPAKLDEFLKRFTNLWELANPSTNQAQTAGLLFGQSEQFGISTELMLTIQQLK
ncbi:MAG: DUF1217 domain-containing protein [Rhizobiaceae bacterium]